MPYSAERKLNSRQRILNSAIELFCKNGFQQVSISQVMSLARMTHGAFYSHFESKEALFKESLYETFRKSQATRLAKAPFSLRHLTMLVNNYLNLRNLTEKSDPAPEMILFNEVGSENEEIRSLYQRAYFDLLAILKNRILALKKLKKLEYVDDAQDRARAVLATLVGAVAIAKSINDQDEQEKLLLTAQNQILSMLGADVNLYAADASLIAS